MTVLVVLGAVPAVALGGSWFAARSARGPAAQAPATSAGMPMASTAAARARTVADPTGRGTGHRARRGRGLGRGRGITAPAILVGTAALLAGCTSAARAVPPPRHHVTTSAVPPTTTAPPSTVAPTTAPPTTTVAPTTSPPPPAPRAAPADIAGQQVVVSAAGYGATTAVLTAYQRTTAGWRVAFGPYTANLGRDGFAPPGQKREGDGRTPSGTYGIGFAFGVLADPGLRLPFRPVTGPNIVWDDDPSSPLYNQWVDDTTADPGANPEPMDNTPAYDYGALIDYNTSPVVPGAGSAIFLHVSTGGTTAGCVALPQGELLAVLRWLDPAQQPVMVMGVGASAPG